MDLRPTFFYSRETETKDFHINSNFTSIKTLTDVTTEFMGIIFLSMPYANYYFL